MAGTPETLAQAGEGEYTKGAKTMNIALTKTEIAVNSFFFPRYNLLPEFGIKAYSKHYLQKTVEAKIEAYKQPAEWTKKLNFDYEKVISEYLLAN
jgi:hypothetical protein